MTCLKNRRIAPKTSDNHLIIDNSKEANHMNITGYKRSMTTIPKTLPRESGHVFVISGWWAIANPQVCKESVLWSSKPQFLNFLSKCCYSVLANTYLFISAWIKVFIWLQYKIILWEYIAFNATNFIHTHKYITCLMIPLMIPHYN